MNRKELRDKYQQAVNRACADMLHEIFYGASPDGVSLVGPLPSKIYFFKDPQAEEIKALKARVAALEQDLYGDKA